jgi:hypothetical protein
MQLVLAVAVTLPVAAPADMVDAAATHHTEALLAELHEVNGPYAGDEPDNVTQWRHLVADYFEPEDLDRAMQILECESHGDPYAENPRSSAAGLFQFLRGTWDHTAEQLGLPTYAAGGPFNAADNIEAAAWLVYEGGGWGHWTCAPRSWR